MIRVPHALAVVFRQAVAQNAFFVDIAGGIESIFNAGGEVFGAVRGGGVHDAGPGVHGDVVGEYAENLSVKKWVLEVLTLKLPARKMCKFARARETTLLGHVSCEL